MRSGGGMIKQNQKRTRVIEEKEVARNKQISAEEAQKHNAAMDARAEEHKRAMEAHSAAAASEGLGYKRRGRCNQPALLQQPLQSRVSEQDCLQHVAARLVQACWRRTLARMSTAVLRTIVRRACTEAVHEQQIEYSEEIQAQAIEFKREIMQLHSRIAASSG